MKVSKNTRSEVAFEHHMVIIHEGNTMLRITFDHGEFRVTKVDIEGNSDAIKLTPLASNQIKLS